MADDFFVPPPFCPPSATASADEDLSYFDHRHRLTCFDSFFYTQALFGEETDYLDENDHTPLTLDLFHRRPALPPLISTVSPEEPPSISQPHGFSGSGSPLLELGSGFDSEEEEEEEDDEEHEMLECDADRGSLVCDWMWVDFFPGRMSSPFDTMEFSMNSQADFQGLPVVGLDSDEHMLYLGNDQMVGTGPSSVTEEGSIGVSNNLACPFGCDLDERWRNTNEDFECEEVDGQTEERDAPGFTFARDEENSGDIGESMDEVSRIEEDALLDLEWEFLIAAYNSGRPFLDLEYADPFFDDDHDYEAYDMFLWQFTEHDSNVKGGPPAAKSVVDNLPSVVLTKEDIDNDHAICAVCKDGILLGEKIKKLPCSHHYHQDCILPWLVIRNTCPLCRFELPTDDPEYEKQKSIREAGRVVN